MAVTISSKEMLATLEQQATSTMSKIVKIKQFEAKEADILAHSDEQLAEINLIQKTMEFNNRNSCKEALGGLERFFKRADEHPNLDPILSEKITKLMVERVNQHYNFDPIADVIQDVLAEHERVTRVALERNKKEQDDLVLTIKTEDQLTKENQALKD